MSSAHAHFITYEGRCERLHGHNYRVAAEISGELNADHLVVDFLAVRDALGEIVNSLDHYVLLPTDHERLVVVEEGKEVRVEFEGRRWIFPRGDYRLLPVANTTAELLSAYIGGLLRQTCSGLEESHLRIELDECDGQLAIWESRPS